MKLKKHIALLTIALALTAGACSSGDDTSDAPPTTGAGATTAAPVDREVVLLTHDSFDISEETLASFKTQTGITVKVLQGGDAGTVVNQAILTKDNPTADVLYGVDNTFLSRALAEEIFVPYTASGIDDIEPDLIADDRVTPIDFGDVCLNFDRDVFLSAGVIPPTSLEQLTESAYSGQLVVQNPASSSPGLAFLLATIAEFPEDADYTWKDFWADLRDNDVLVTSGWEEAYYSNFSGGAGEGDRPLVVSYASSPPVEVLFAEEPTDTAPTGAVAAGCFRQIEYAGVLDGAANPDEARSLIDFMITLEFQEDIPLHMFVYPANVNAELPEVFTRHSIVPDNPLTIDPTEIEENRQRWIEEWTDIMQR